MDVTKLGCMTDQVDPLDASRGNKVANASLSILQDHFGSNQNDALEHQVAIKTSNEKLWFTIGPWMPLLFYNC